MNIRNEGLNEPLKKISGRVVHGNHRGRVLGFPTANLLLSDPTRDLPEPGVYAVLVTYNETVYPGMANVGICPTFGGNAFTVEIHLFNFQEDIYGRTLSVSFIAFLRNEKKFPSIEALKNQLALDEKKALRLLEHPDDSYPGPLNPF